MKRSMIKNTVFAFGVAALSLWNCQAAHAQQRVKNERNPDGSITVDSAIEWVEFNSIDAALNGSPGYWQFDGIVEASTPGFTGLGFNDYKWDIEGLGNLLTIDQLYLYPIVDIKVAHQRQLRLFPVQGSVTGKTSKVTVTVTDPSDGAVAKNIYNIRWHMPFEKWSAYAPEQQIWDYPTLEIEEPGYAISGGSIKVKWNYEGCFWGDIAQTVIPVASAIVPGPYGGLFEVAGVGINQAGSKPDSNSAVFDSCWGKEGSNYTPSRNDAKKNRYEMTPVLRIGYTTKFFEGDAYNKNGYVGPQKKVVQPFDGRREFVGDFNLANPGNDDPNQP